MKKLVVVSVLFISLVTGALAWWLQTPPPALSLAEPRGAPAPLLLLLPPPPPPALAAPAPSLPPEGPAEVPGEVPRPAPAPSPPDAQALLARARAQAAEVPEDALRTLRQLERVAPDLARAPKTELVRLEALLRLGRRSEAEALAERLTNTPSRELKPRDVARVLEETHSK